MAPIEAKEGTPYAFLLKRLIFYQSYHNNFWNKLIHVICVPLIVWGALALLCRLQVNLPVFGEVEVGLLTTIFYGALYTGADFSSGVSWVTCVGLPLLSAARWLNATFDSATSKWYAIGLIVFGFYVQVHPGHYILEKRKPALLDSFLEANLAAPLFVWLEVLFWLGFKKDLQHHVEGEAAKLIASYKKKGK